MRYVLRPPFAHEQLSLTPDGQILLRLTRPFADGTSALRFEPTAFLERLVALIPRPGRPCLTYHGILAPAASWRDHVVPLSPPRRRKKCAAQLPPNPAEPDELSRRYERSTWSELLRKVFALDVLICDVCGGKRALIAFLTAPESIRHILDHLGLPTRPPPIRSAPADLFECA